jgi:phospholipase C
MASLDHIIVLMLENNSFDRMLGALFPERIGGGGIKGTAANHWNDDTSPAPKPPIRHVMLPTISRTVTPDPMHEYPNVVNQQKGPNLGFVTDFATTYPATDWMQRQEIMGYYDDGVLPNLQTLAKQYTVCDRWFSSMPGPTWPNRVFVHTGTSLGYTTNSVGNNWDQWTLYDLLGDNGISWKIYYGDGDVSQTLVLKHAPWVDPMRYFYLAAQAAEADFPQYCFLEPNYGTFPWDKVSQNDQHPLSDVFRGERLIFDVYNALRANDALWQRSLLVITYDEHGGFYDHVDPPAAVRPDNRTDATGFKFDRLGLRVPTILLSPWLDQGVINDTFDHTSLLKFLLDKWNLTNLLGDRVGSVSTNTFAKYLRKTPRPTYNLLPKSNIPVLHATPESTELSDNQRSMIELGHHLAAQISEPNVRTAMMTRSAARTPKDDAQLAVEQFRSFMIDRAKHPTKSKPLPKKQPLPKKKKARSKAAVKATKAVKARKKAKRRAKK